MVRYAYYFWPGLMKHLLQIEEPWYRFRSLYIHHFNLQLYLLFLPSYFALVCLQADELNCGICASLNARRYTTCQRHRNFSVNLS